MDVRSYCDAMNNQLTGWKASIYDIILTAEKLGGQDKQSVQPMIDSLNSIIVELNQNLAELKDQCPADWSPQKQDIDLKMTELRKNFEQLSDKIQNLVPDTTAWV